MEKKRIFTEVEEYEILKLFNKGYTQEVIAAHLGTSYATVNKIIKKFKTKGLYIRGRVSGKKRMELEPLQVKEDTFKPHKAIFANVVENIKTPELIIDGERYVDVTQIICNSNEIAAMGKKFVGVRKNGKKKTL